MPNWITVFHFMFSDVGGSLVSRQNSYWLAISCVLGVWALIVAALYFAENASKHTTKEERCKNSKIGLRMLLAMLPVLLLGNYAGILMGIAVLCGLLFCIFTVLKGVGRSIGACRTTKI